MSKLFRKRWDAHKGSTINVSHDFAPYATLHSTTLSSAAVQNTDSGISVQNEAVASTLWSGQIVCGSTGNYSYELAGTFADGSVEVLEFVVQVFDRAPTQAVNEGYR